MHPVGWVPANLLKCCGLEIKRRKRKEEQPILLQELLQTSASIVGKGKVEISSRGTQPQVQKRKPERKTVVMVNGHNMSARTIRFPLLRIMCFAGKVIHTDIIKKRWMRSPAGISSTLPHETA